MLYKAEQSNCSVKFSPFLQGRIALACAQNFGIVGNGSVVVLQAQETGLQRVAGFDTVDGAWPLEPPARDSLCLRPYTLTIVGSFLTLVSQLTLSSNVV